MAKKPATVYTSQGAEFDENRIYRYSIWRTWEEAPPLNADLSHPRILG